MEQMEIVEMLYEITADLRTFMNEQSKVPYLIRRICISVEKYPSSSQETVSKKLNMDKSLLARNVKTAQMDGYIRREVSPVDNRKAELYITEKGEQLNAETKSLIHEWTNRAFSKLNESEKRQLSYLLNNVMRSL